MSDKSEEYEYVTAIIGLDGDLRWEYKVKGAEVAGRMTSDLDDDFSSWTDNEVVQHTMEMLDVPEHQRNIVKVEWD